MGPLNVRRVRGKHKRVIFYSPETPPPEGPEENPRGLRDVGTFVLLQRVLGLAGGCARRGVRLPGLGGFSPGARSVRASPGTGGAGRMWGAPGPPAEGQRKNEAESGAQAGRPRVRRARRPPRAASGIAAGLQAAPALQPRRRGGVSWDEPAPFIQEVKATSGSMKTNGEPGGKEGGRGGGSAGAREGTAVGWKREREAGCGRDLAAAAAAARPGMSEPAPRCPRAPRGGSRPGL